MAHKIGKKIYLHLKMRLYVDTILKDKNLLLTLSKLTLMTLTFMEVSLCLNRDHHGHFMNDSFYVVLE
jgi:hypothetical protein